ncbi:MAG: short-chain dehydrogenase [Anaerolineaceae bacterium]|nr:short-chain dehydrogenase [Anaerolineaceae bacterium]
MAGQVALVTGAGGGIGSAVTQRLAQAGARVVMTYRSSADETHALAAGLPGDDHMVVQVQVDDSDALKALADQVRARYGRLDILVNNAGATRFVPHDDLDALDDDLIDMIFRTNWRGAFACVRAFKDLLAEGDGGVVINMSSIAGTTGLGSNVAYAASKAGLDSMTRSLGRALAPQIRFVSVSPGLVEGKYASSFDPAWKQGHVDQTPLGRLATGDDVADMVLAAAAYMPLTTGVILNVDGGRFLP